MSFNTFGRALRVTTWGESHGPAIGCVIDGVPPDLPVDEAELQRLLDRRKPGSSSYVTPRQEADAAHILSGVYDDGQGLRTTGHPVAIEIRNTDARSKDYSKIADVWRPGHADRSYDLKYGIRDPRGGGRSSARETAMRVAAAALARPILSEAVDIRAGLIAMGPLRLGEDDRDWTGVETNPLNVPTSHGVEAWQEALDGARSDRTSFGGVVEVMASGVPAGLGEPVYGKLDAELAAALMGINAAKGVEIGDGFAAASTDGSEAADELAPAEGDGEGEGITALSNRAGGILGGISTGEPIVARVAFKPTSSLPRARRTVNRAGEAVETEVRGRHDPCVAIRAVPVVEAMMVLTLADHLLRHRGQTGRPGPVQWG